MIETQSLNHRVDVISPQHRVVVTLARLIRKTMTTHVHRDKPVIVGQIRASLPTPSEPTLREAVDE
jgi:hypothetical protein